VLGCPDVGPRCETIYEPPPTPGDVDGDGIENDLDDDADGDGVDNTFEHHGGNGCAGPDDDMDGVANWLDRDSDNDGLLDGTEYENDGNPYNADSDGDGYSDLFEAAAGTRVDDATSGPRDEDTVLVGVLGAAPQVLDVRVPNRIENADVFFLVDTTGSMSEERDNLVEAISEFIVPRLVTSFDDVAFGAAGLDDYPVGEFGGTDDLPFYLLTKMVDGLTDTMTATSSTCSRGAVRQLTEGSNDVPDIEDAIGNLACHNGADLPEGFVPALWVTATGRELAWEGGMVPAQSDCSPEEIGYPCFRPDALPIIVLIGDAKFHNGPDVGGENEPYDFAAPTYADTIDELNLIGAKVVSIYSGPESEDGDYQRLARDTNTVNSSGSPLVFPIAADGSGIDSTVVNGIESLAEGVTQDVTLAVADGDDHPSDATALVTSWRAVEGYAPDGTPGPMTGVSYEDKNDTTFMRVAPGADVEFEVTIQNTTISPMEETIVVVIKLNFVGQGGAVFVTRRYFVVITEDPTVLVGLME